MLKNLWLNITASPERILNSVKTALACFIGILITQYFHFSMPQWVLVSILVVMASSVRMGGMLKKSYLRILGTIVGAVVAALVLFLLRDHQILTNIMMLVCIAIFIYIASAPSDVSGIGLLGAVTIVMVLNVPSPSFKIDLDRTLETILGIVIALFVSRLVFPVHARELLIKNIGKNLQDITELYKKYISHEVNSEAQSALENSIIKNFAKQVELLKEGIAEKSSFRQKRGILEKIIGCERRLVRSFYVLHETLVAIDDPEHLIYHDENFIKLNEILVIDLNNLSKAILHKKVPVLQIPTENFSSRVRKIFREIQNQNLFKSDVKAHTFLFCIYHINKVINELTQLVEQIKQ